MIFRQFSNIVRLIICDGLAINYLKQNIDVLKQHVLIQMFILNNNTISFLTVFILFLTVLTVIISKQTELKRKKRTRAE